MNKLFKTLNTSVKVEVNNKILYLFKDSILRILSYNYNENCYAGTEVLVNYIDDEGFSYEFNIDILFVLDFNKSIDDQFNELYKL